MDKFLLEIKQAQTDSYVRLSFFLKKKTIIYLVEISLYLIYWYIHFAQFSHWNLMLYSCLFVGDFLPYLSECFVCWFWQRKKKWNKLLFNLKGHKCDYWINLVALCKSVNDLLIDRKVVCRWREVYKKISKTQVL